MGLGSSRAEVLLCLPPMGSRPDSDEGDHPFRRKATTRRSEAMSGGSWLVEVVGLGFSCSPFFSVYDLVVAGVVEGRGNRRGWAVEGGRGGGPGAGFQAVVETADRGPRRAGAAER